MTASAGSARTDADLVRDTRLGCREALAELVARHWSTAVFLAGRVLESADLGRDAAQEAAIAAMTDLDRLRSPDRFGAWFCGIALNVARRWRRQLGAEITGAETDQAAAAPGPAEISEAADTARRVRDAISTLAEGQQQAIFLFYLQGLSHREVADDLGISIGAVKSRLHQARVALAPRLIPVTENPKGRIMSTPEESEWIDVSVTEIRRAEGEDATPRKHVMILRERGGDRQLPIWIGPAEATAMALALESVESPRPFTHKLAASLVQAAGGEVAEVRITRLADSVFYSAIIVDSPDGQREVDARPSDAVNLALVAGTPIRVARRLLSAGPAAELLEKLRLHPVATAQIAAEARERQRELRDEIAPGT